MWIVAGVKTLGITGSTFKNCAPITNATLQGLCGDAQTLVIFALLSAGICEYRLSALSGYMCGVPLRRGCARDVRCSIDVMLTLNVNLPVAVYTAALTFAAVGSSSKGKPIWTHFSMPGAKRH